MPLGGQPINPQPGGRAPAPGDLALVQAFINSNYDLELDHGAELLASPEALTRWLRRWRLIDGKAKATESDLDRALALREDLRGLLIARHEGREASLTAEVTATVLLTTGEARLDAAPGNGVARALDLVLARAAVAQLTGSLARLKACRECRWAFYDHSKNGGGSWCSMKVCGGRVKQRSYYRRISRSDATA
jgi:predicted RNA-binding Zn ribbon-like protein